MHRLSPLIRGKFWVFVVRLEKLLERLKSLVADSFIIELRVNVPSRGNLRGEVTLVSSTNKYCWTHFRAENIEQALRKAIDKLRHPNKDYVDEDGQTWKAKESSVYSAEHIKIFLRKT